jgi:hypothetical protein
MNIAGLTLHIMGNGAMTNPAGTFQTTLGENTYKDEVPPHWLSGNQGSTG